MRSACRGRRTSDWVRRNRVRPNRTSTLTVVVALAAVFIASACAVGPDIGPGLVPAGTGGGDSPAPTSSSVQIPALETPRTDVRWSPCGAQLSATYATTVPAGVTIECGRLDSPIDPDRPDTTVSIALTRARLATTPADAAPLVLTSGSDMPSARALLLLAAGPGRTLLAQHPVVSADRRGIPRSGPVDCLAADDRIAIANNGLTTTTTSTAARIGRLAEAAASAADSCAETLSPNQLHFGISAAASDLETLRKKWNVARLGLIGIGEGSDVVLAYTAGYGGRSGRIILDTPTPFGANARDSGAAKASGVQAALHTFAQRCAAQAACPFGTNGEQVMARVLAKGRAQTLGGGLSDTAVLAAITTGLALAPSTPTALTTLAGAITAADRGATSALASYADTAVALRLSDGQIVAGCNDVTGPIGQNEISGLADTWGKQNPLTGLNSALDLVRCNGWASIPPVNPPNSFPVPPLILNGAGDPINGGTGADTLTALFAKASTEPVRVEWDGLGYSVLARSSCAADTVAAYIRSAPLAGPSERGCPA
ncbi:MAG: alpha/beta hydrolase [Gordonia sp. (in: high G+C Gram-positive bacteria)]